MNNPQLFFRPSKTIVKVVANVSNLTDVDNTLQALNLTSGEIPDKFDLYRTNKHNINYLSPIQDQGKCGSCWSMSSTSVLTDRFRILKGYKDLVLNPLIAVSCSTEINKGCDGGLPSECGLFFEKIGTGSGSNSCVSWDKHCLEGGKDCLNPPSCKNMNGCDKNYKALEGSTKSLVVTNSDKSVNADLTIIGIKADIMNSGPVVCCVFIPYSIYDPQFWPETNGVFINGLGLYNNRLNNLFKGKQVMGKNITNWDDIQSDENGNKAGHAMTIVGWGIEYVEVLKRDIPYWIIRNSWGERWAENGFFKYAIFNEELKINTNLGLDVPISDNGELFGSCTTFLPNLETGAENMIMTQVYNYADVSGYVNTTNKKNWKKLFITISIYLAILIGVLIILFALYKLYQKRNDIYNYFSSVKGPKINIQPRVDISQYVNIDKANNDSIDNNPITLANEAISSSKRAVSLAHQAVAQAEKNVISAENIANKAQQNVALTRKTVENIGNMTSTLFNTV